MLADLMAPMLVDQGRVSSTAYIKGKNDHHPYVTATEACRDSIPYNNESSSCTHKYWKEPAKSHENALTVCVRLGVDVEVHDLPRPIRVDGTQPLERLKVAIPWCFHNEPISVVY